MVKVVLTAGIAVGLAFLVAALTRPGDGPPGEEPGASSLRRGGPGFYLDLEPEERRQLIRERLAHLTSAEALELGPLKEDLALLLQGPEEVDIILEAFARRSDLSRYEAAGFCDLFALVRHPRFVKPLVTLLDHPEASVRIKAGRAAGTQADPRLTPGLQRLYEDRLAVAEEKGGAQTRSRIVRTAVACGGDQMPGLVARALEDPDPLVVAVAADAVGEAELVSFLPRLEGLLDASVPQVVLNAAGSLAALGREAGVRALEGLLDPRRPELARSAAFMLQELDARSAIPALRRHAGGASPDLGMAFAVARAALGDNALAARMAAELASRDGIRRHTAVAVLAASGDPRHRPALHAALDREGRSLIPALSLGLAASPAPPDRELVMAMLAAGPLHGAHVKEVVTRLGDQLLPHLERLIRSTDKEDEGRLMVLIGAVGDIGSRRARRTLLRLRPCSPRLVEGRLRLLDLELRREGLWH